MSNELDGKIPCALAGGNLQVRDYLAQLIVFVNVLRLILIQFPMATFSQYSRVEKLNFHEVQSTKFMKTENIFRSTL